MRSVILASGGIESLVVSALFRERHPDGFGHAIHVRYGQRPVDQESRAVRRACERYGLTLASPEASLPWLEDHAMIDPSKVIVFTPDGTSQGNIVPYRNLAFLGMAAMYAATLGAEEVWTGFDYNPGTSGSSRDKSPEFVVAMNEAMSAAYDGTARSPVVVAPLQGNRKEDTIRLGQSLGVDWASSWSCYNDYARPCGVCGSCVPRMRAFTSVGLTDVPYCSAEFIAGELGG